MVHGLLNLARIHSDGLEFRSSTAAMADLYQNSASMDDYSGSSADETNSGVVEKSMWDEWTYPSNVGDEVSTSNVFLPDLCTSSSTTSSRLAFQHSDMLSSWMSTFQPLSHPPLGSLATPEPVDNIIDPHSAHFMQEGGLDLEEHDPHDPSLGSETYPRFTTSISISSTLHPSSEPLPYVPAEDSSSPHPSGLLGLKASVSRHLLQALCPQSPSSPLAIQNGMLNPLGDPWDGCPTAAANSNLPSWPLIKTGQNNYGYTGTTHSRVFNIPDHSASAIDHQLEDQVGRGSTSRFVSRPRHTDIFIGPNGTFESTPGGWTPQFYDGSSQEATVVKPMKTMASLRELATRSTSTEGDSGHRRHVADHSADRSTMGGYFNNAGCRRGDQSKVSIGKHHLELTVDGDDNHSALQLKRSKLRVDHGTTLKWGDQGLRAGGEMRTYNYSPNTGSLLASQAMDIIAVGPALNTNGKPRARRGSATDPQSVYARQRRERINDRLKTLQHLVPNGAKVDIVTMLEEAYDYVKFLQYQVTLLKSDEFWMHATPYNYNGMDISNLSSVQTQELESSA